MSSLDLIKVDNSPTEAAQKEIKPEVGTIAYTEKHPIYEYSRLKKQKGSSDDINTAKSPRGVRPVDAIIGIIRRIDDNKAYVEFDKEGQLINRTISLASIKQYCKKDPRPGDLIGLITSRHGSSFQTSLQYFGSGIKKLSPEILSKIDKIYKRKYQ